MLFPFNLNLAFVQYLEYFKQDLKKKVCFYFLLKQTFPSCGVVDFIRVYFVFRLLLRKESQVVGIQHHNECNSTVMKQDLFRSPRWNCGLILFPLLYFQMPCDDLWSSTLCKLCAVTTEHSVLKKKQVMPLYIEDQSWSIRKLVPGKAYKIHYMDVLCNLDIWHLYPHSCTWSREDFFSDFGQDKRDMMYVFRTNPYNWDKWSCCVKSFRW